MAPLSKEGRSLIGAALTESWLLQINQYAYDNELIDRETYMEMQIKIKLNHKLQEQPKQRNRKTYTA